jgi:hypothetical protein
MWLPHHVAFYTGKKVVVLPTGDIAQTELSLLHRHLTKKLVPDNFVTIICTINNIHNVLRRCGDL